MSNPGDPVEGQQVVIEKTDEALVYDVRKPDGSPFTQEDYQASKAHTTADRLRTLTNFKVCAEGDSWINILWPFSAAKGYNQTFVDIVEEDRRFYVNNLGWPGDKFEDIVKDKQYKVPIQSQIYDFFILSGGGNDFLGGGSLEHFIKPYASVPRSSPPQDYIDHAKLTRIFGEVERGYAEILHEVSVWSPKTEILLQGYDYAIPRKGGQWMGTPFAKLGYALDQALPAQIIHLIVDEFYKVLDRVRHTANRVHVMNNRHQLDGHWHDELHPDEVAARKLGKSYIEEMVKLKLLV